jgi:hypothetical protein
MSDFTLIGRLGTFVALIMSAYCGFQPNYGTEVILWFSCLLLTWEIRK